MSLDYLKYIEVIMKHLVQGNSLDFTKIHEESLSNIKNNLFNLITINKLLRNYQEFHKLNLKRFFATGVIPSIYDKPIRTPDFPYLLLDNEQELLKVIIKSLQENNYTFTKNHNILISNKLFELEIPQEWLYRLTEYFSNMKYRTVYLYNKNIENNITDEYSLVNYLYHTKTFYLEMLSEEENPDYESVVQNSTNITNRIMRKKKKVSVDDIASTFSDNIPKSYNLEITKFKMPSSLYILRHVHETGPTFYKKSLRQTQKDIKTWLLEYLNSQNLDDEFTQKYLLSLKENSPLKLSKSNREKIIRSLFCLYITLLNEFDLNFNTISLSDFKIKNYASKYQQDNLAKLRKLIKKINDLEEKAEYKEIVKNINKTMQEIETLNSNEDYGSLVAKKSQLDDFIKMYEEYEKERISLLHERNSLQNLITASQFNDLTELAFDNERIMSLIDKATVCGRIYINPLDLKKMVIEINNKENGSPSFTCEITLKNLISFIENTNKNIEYNKLSLAA